MPVLLRTGESVEQQVSDQVVMQILFVVIEYLKSNLRQRTAKVILGPNGWTLYKHLVLCIGRDWNSFQ